MVGAVSIYLMQIRKLWLREVKPQDHADPAHKWQSWDPPSSLGPSLCSNASLARGSLYWGEKKVHLGILWKKKKQDCEKLKWLVSPQRDYRGW